jgi:hypothetical protein
VANGDNSSMCGRGEEVSGDAVRGDTGVGDEIQGNDISWR